MAGLTRLRSVPAWLLIAVAVLVAAGGGSYWAVTAGGSQAAGPEMSLTAANFEPDGSGVVCDDPDKPTKCTIPAGSTFALSVAVNGLPSGPYIGIQTVIVYGGLVYKPTATAAGEIVWPESVLSVRSPPVPSGLEGRIDHGSASGVVPPFVESTHVGSIVEIALNCPAEPQTSKLALLPYNPETNPSGAGFKLADLTVVPAKTVGQQDLDLDSDTTPETVDVAATLEINCVDAAATPTETAALAPPAPTALPPTQPRPTEPPTDVPPATEPPATAEQTKWPALPPPPPRPEDPTAVESATLAGGQWYELDGCVDFYLPAGWTLTVQGGVADPGGGFLGFSEEVSGSAVFFYQDSLAEWSRTVSDPRLSPVFDQIAATIQRAC